MSELRPSFLKNVSLEDLEIGANGRDAKKRSHALVGTLLGHPGHSVGFRR